MKYINIFRGIVTTLIGVVLMLVSLYFYLWAPDDFELDLTTAIIMFVAGLVLLLMPDDIPAFIRTLFARKYGAPPPPPGGDQHKP
jgi:hypothetical protein